MHYATSARNGGVRLHERHTKQVAAEPEPELDPEQQQQQQQQQQHNVQPKAEAAPKRVGAWAAMWPHEQLRELFVQLDRDKSGGLSISEFRAFVDMLGVVALRDDQLLSMINDSIDGDAQAADSADSLELGIEGFTQRIGQMIDNLDAAASSSPTAEPELIGEIEYEPMALGCLSLKGPVRPALIALITHPAFDLVVLVLIMANATLLALEDPLSDPDNPTEFEERLSLAELAFTILFTVEMVTKILALGLVGGPNTYLQSGWNILDAVVVTTAWLPYLLRLVFDLESSYTTVSSIIRTFRLLRPLRSIHRFPGLQRLVTTILLAAPQLQVLGIMMSIFFFTYGVVGVQLWHGTLRQRCVNTQGALQTCEAGDENVCASEAALFGAEPMEFCDIAATSSLDLPWQGTLCPAGDTCSEHHSNPYWGKLSFDHMGAACIPILQMATMSSWQEVMHRTTDTSGSIVKLYFVTGVILGGYFLFSLFIAELKNQFEVAMAVFQEGAEIFAAIDTDHSGALNETEMGQVFNLKGVSLSKVQLHEMFTRIDKDHSGAVSKSEFLQWLRSDDLMAAQLRERLNVGSTHGSDDAPSHVSDTVLAELPLLDRIREILCSFNRSNEWGTLFSYYDTDGNGLLELKEFTVILRRDIGLRPDQLSDTEIREVFDDVDTGDGTIDAGEFAQWVVQASTAGNWVKVRAAIELNGLGRVQDLLSQEMSAGMIMGGHVADVANPVFEVDGAVAMDGERGLTRLGSEPGLARKSGARQRETMSWRTMLRVALVSYFVEYLLGLIVLLNTVVLMLEYHGMSEDYSSWLAAANALLTVLFVLEMTFKLVAFSWAEFVESNGINGAWGYTGVLDLILAFAALLDVVARAAEWDIVVTTLLLLRACRPLRLVWIFSRFEPVFLVAAKTLAGLAYIVSLAVLFMFIFAVLGMQLFGGKFDFNDGAPKPREHYDTFWVAFTTSFQIMTFDTWHMVMYNAMRARGGAAVLYFLLWVILGALILLNLLLVIILDVYVQTSEDHQDQPSRAEMRDSLRESMRDGMAAAPPKLSSRRSLSAQDRQHSKPASAAATFDAEDTVASLDNAIDMNAAHDKSLSLFSRQSAVRKFCQRIADSPKTDTFIIACIAANCAQMGADHPGIEPNTPLRRSLDVADFIFTVIFTLEMAVRVIAHGFYATERAYMKDGWNRLDCSIVVVSWVDYLVQSLDIESLRSLRLLRALRALRLFNRMHGLKVLIDSLFDSIATLGTIFTVTFIIFIVYALFGVSVFQGTFGRCDDNGDAVEGLQTCVGTWVANDGTVRPRKWEVPHNNFDSVPAAMFTLFTVSTSNDWIITAQMAVDAVTTETLKQPVREHSPAKMFYFMCFIMMVNFFLLNLFVGVIYGKYVEISNEGIQDLSKPQRQWLEISHQLTYAEPVREIRKLRDGHERTSLRHRVFLAVTHTYFDRVIIAAILVNAVQMATTFYGEPHWWTTTQDLFNMGFAIIFTVEAMLKIFGFGPYVYFTDGWCRFDFVVILGAWADVLCTVLGLNLFSSSLFRIIRVSRVIGRLGRMLKLVGDAKATLGLEEIFACLYQSLPQLGYIAILISLALYIFACLAMNLFGKVAHVGCINQHTNFERIDAALLTLLGVVRLARLCRCPVTNTLT
jgi:Ca2+-binding EF-hand superfamily protein